MFAESRLPGRDTSEHSNHCRISGRKMIARPSGLGYSFVEDVLPLLSSKWLHQLSDSGVNIFTPHNVIMTDEAF